VSVKGHTIRVYVLIGHPKDTIELAEKRLVEVVKLGGFPQSMLWRDSHGVATKQWRQFHRTWANTIIVGSKVKKLLAGHVIAGQKEGSMVKKRRARVKYG
jgi:hypothetical protein